MYLIITSSGVIEDITPHISYVRLQTNVYMVCCGQADATAIYGANSDLFYSTERYSAVWVDIVPANVEPRYWQYINGNFAPNPDTAAEHEQRQRDAANIASVPQLRADTDYIAIMMEVTL